MEEQSESASQERVVIPPELQSAMGGAKDRIVEQAKLPEKDILERTAGLSFAGAMKEAIIPHVKKMGEISFKDFKATLMAALSLVPLLSQGASAARIAGKAERMGAQSMKTAAKIDKLEVTTAIGPDLMAKMTEQAEKAAKAAYEMRNLKNFPDFAKIAGKYDVPLEIAARVSVLSPKKIAIFADELDKGVKVGRAFEHATRGINTTTDVLFKAPLVGEVTKGGLKFGARRLGETIVETKIHEVLHLLNPYPDVPSMVGMVGFLDLIPGVEGAELIPAGWQLVSDRIQSGKERFGMYKDISKVVLDRMGIKFNNLKEPKVAKAAEVFVPAPASA